MQTLKKENYKNYLQLAQTGHYPLFFDEWVHASMNQGSLISLKRANHNVRSVFNLLDRHKTVEKKKTALMTLDKITREEFIRSFFKIVEHEVLKEDLTLQ